MNARLKSALGDIRHWIDGNANVVIVGRDAVDRDVIVRAAYIRMYGRLPRVRILAGGFAAWKKAGHPIAHGWDMGSLLGKEKQ